MTASIHVVIVTFNALRWIDKCLGCLRDSSVPVTITVVDNGSTDQTVNAVITKHSAVHVLQQDKNLGFGQANNIGMRRAYDAGADYVFLLNQDAWVDRECIERLVKVQRLQSHYGIVSPVQLNGTRTGLDYNFSVCIAPDRCAGLYSDKWLNCVKDKIYQLQNVPAAAWLISRACLEKVGGFSPAFFHYGEDDNYVQRARYHGFEVGIYPNAIAYHDRENRPHSAFFDIEAAEFRDMLIKMNNPLDEYDMKRARMKTQSALIRLFLRANIKKFSEKLYEYKRAKEAWRISVPLRRQTMEPGSHFL